MGICFGTETKVKTTYKVETIEVLDKPNSTNKPEAKVDKPEDKADKPEDKADKPDTLVFAIDKPVPKCEDTLVFAIDKPVPKCEDTLVFAIDTPVPKWEDTLVFVPPITDGIVIKVYDGDTITIAQKLPYENSPLFRFAIRLNGIDSPEIKTKYESEKKYAERSRDALHHLIFQKTVSLKNISLEKYGRILADVYYNDIHINKWLLDNKYAIPYDGTKKREWNDVITLYEK